MMAAAASVWQGYSTALACITDSTVAMAMLGYDVLIIRRVYILASGL